jgi:putative sterol carrier protein
MQAGQPKRAFDAAVSAREFNAIVGRIDDATLARTMADDQARAVVLHGIFGQLPDRLAPERAAGLDATIHWRIGSRPDEWTVRICDGNCSVSEGLSGVPTVSLSIDSVAFLRLISGAATGVGMLLSGKLRLRGSMMFARQIEKLFNGDSGAVAV